MKIKVTLDPAAKGILKELRGKTGSGGGMPAEEPGTIELDDAEIAAVANRGLAHLDGDDDAIRAAEGALTETTRDKIDQLHDEITAADETD